MGSFVAFKEVNWEQVASRMMQRQGFLIISSDRAYQPGDLHSEESNVQQPFCVLGTATYEEWMTQRYLGVEILKELGFPPIDIGDQSKDHNFYKFL